MSKQWHHRYQMPGPKKIESILTIAMYMYTYRVGQKWFKVYISWGKQVMAQ